MTRRLPLVLLLLTGCAADRTAVVATPPVETAPAALPAAAAPLVVGPLPDVATPPIRDYATGTPRLIAALRPVPGDTLRFDVRSWLFPGAETLTFNSSPTLAATHDPATGIVSVLLKRTTAPVWWLTFRYRDGSYDVPILPRPAPVEHVFRFRPTRPIRSVSVAGSFNGWNKDALPMVGQSGVYEARATIPAGEYAYKFVVDGDHWQPDPGNPKLILPDSNSVLSVGAPTGPLPQLLMDSATTDPSGASILRWRLVDAGPGATVWAVLDNHRLADRQITVRGDQLTATLPTGSAPGACTLRLYVASADGRTGREARAYLVDGKPEPVGRQMASWRDGIIYFLMVDRFADGDRSNDRPIPGLAAPANFQGGDLAGVLQQIERGYFDSLGVTTLWLSPVVQNPDSAYREYPEPHRPYSGYHGYWPVSQRAVDPRFGDWTLIRRVTDAAHARGMTVLLDFVSHHVHEAHPFVRQHPDWFGKLTLPDGTMNLRLWDEQRLTTWFDTFLPTLAYVERTDVIDTMVVNAIWWLRAANIDGFRHDAAKHIPSTFWQRLTQQIRATEAAGETGGKLPVYQIGETYGSYGLIGSYINNGQMDAQFDFNLMDPTINVLTGSSGDLRDLARTAEASFDAYGAYSVMGTLVGNHDRPRFLAMADGDLEPGISSTELGWQKTIQVDHPSSYDKLVQAHGLILTLPGVPTIYYGDEVGMTGAGDPDNRRMMRFGGQLTAAERSVKSRITTLVQLRRDHPVLRDGDFRTLAVDADSWSFLRCLFSERAVVVLNRRDTPQTITVPVPAWLRGATLTDGMTGRNATLTGATWTVEVPAHGIVVWTGPK